VTAVDRLRDAGRWWIARTAVLGILVALGGVAGCRGTPASTPSSAPPARPLGTPTALTLAAYGDRVGTAAAVLANAPRAATTRAAARTQPDVLATMRALVGSPAPVALRPNAVGEAGSAAEGAAVEGDPSGRVILAQPLAAGARGTAEGTSQPSGTQASTSSDAAVSAMARLEIVRDELDASRADDTAAHAAALDRVLADPAFRDPRSLWQRGWEWVTDRFRRWWGSRGLSSGAGETALRLGQAIGWAVAFIVVATTAVWVARLIARLTDAPRVPNAPGSPPSTPAEARARAEADAGAGDFRSAVRQLYLAALLVLESNGLLRPDRSRTNREQLASLAGDEALRAHMAAVVDTFDRVWYGVTVPDGATFRTYADDVHQLEVLARRASAPPRAGARPTSTPGVPAAPAGDTQ
jgi:hypothetical protein